MDEEPVGVNEHRLMLSQVYYTMNTASIIARGACGRKLCWLFASLRLKSVVSPVHFIPPDVLLEHHKACSASWSVQVRLRSSQGSGRGWRYEPGWTDMKEQDCGSPWRCNWEPVKLLNCGDVMKGGSFRDVTSGWILKQLKFMEGFVRKTKEKRVAII